MHDENRPATPEDLERLWTPILQRLIRERGKEDAVRCFKRAVVAAGFDPRELRVVFNEDVS